MSTLARTFFDQAGRQPDKPALHCEERTLRYGELADLVARWSTAMRTRGVARGDAIGVLLPNCVEFVALMLVAADLGAVLVPLDLSLPAAAVHTAFTATDTRHVVGKSARLHALRAAEGLDFASVSGLWLAVDGEGPGLSLAALLAETDATAAPSYRGGDDDAYILTMTSGSTGDPKPIVLSQRTKLKRAEEAVELYGINAADRILAATPLYHSLAERLVLLPLLYGATAIVMARYSPSLWLECARGQEVTFTIAVSSQLTQIAALLAEAPDALASLRCLVSSSALLEATVKADLLARLRCDFHECYGTSEIAIATDLDAVADAGKLNSVGRPAPGVQVAILGEDDRPAGPDEVGEIVCKTPMLFAGYYRRPEQTRAAMWGDYFRTGDLGRLDAEGYLYYLGRKKELIITGGINVYPADVEAALAAHASVREVAAFALPDPRLGEVVAVALVPRDPAAFDLRRLRFHCAEHLADYQQPRRFFIREALPRNSLGKIMRYALVEEHGQPPDRDPESVLTSPSPRFRPEPAR